MNIISELTSICESIYAGKPVISEKKDDNNPFGASTEDDTNDNDSTDGAETETDSDNAGSPADDGKDETTEETGDGDPDNTDDSDDSDDTDGVPFGGMGSSEEDSPDDSDENNIEDDMGGTTGEEYSDVSDFGITLLMLATQIHFWHINCRSNADHNCLGNLYNDLIDQGDKLLENIVSVTKNSIIAGDNLSFDFGDLDFNKEESIGILEDTRKEADDLVSRYTDNQGLCNIIGDISETLGTAIYMLSRFEN